MTDRIRVVLVDDQPLFRAGVAAVVAAHPDCEVVGEASSGREAVALLDTVEADVVLMDIRMPDLDGAEATRLLMSPERAARRTVPLRVIVLTTFALDERARAAIDVGATGFLLKDASPELLIAAIRAVYEGGAVATGGDLAAFAAPPVTRPAPPPGLSTLTDRERRVYDLVITGASNAEIAAQLYLSESTVKTHVSSVLAKLGARDRVALVVLAHRASGATGSAPSAPTHP